VTFDPDLLLARLRRALAEGPPLRLAILFGSAARGTLHAESDVDVGIIPRDAGLPWDEESDLQVRLTRACGRAVDLVRLDRASTLLRWEAARTAVRLLAEPLSEHPRFIAAAAILCLTAQAQNPTANLTVDLNANRRPINPNVYGVAYATTAQLLDLNVKLHRYGGNNATRYNWQINADNRGADWYFESIGEPSAVAGERGNTFISNSRAGGAEPMLTVPIIGWVAKLGANRSKLASFSHSV